MLNDKKSYCLVIPLPSQDDDLRMILLDIGSERFRGETDQMSLFDELMYSGTMSPLGLQWLSFFALDSLSGRFLAEGEEDGRWTWRWNDLNERPRANRQWFALYWQEKKCWPSRQSDSGVPRFERQILRADPGIWRGRPLWRPVTVNPDSFSDLNKFLQDVRDIFAALKKDGQDSPWACVLEYFEKAFNELDTISVPTGILRYIARNTHRITVDTEALLEWLSSEHLLPKSEVLVRFPPAELVPNGAREQYKKEFGNTWVDLQESVAWPGLTFAKNLCCRDIKDQNGNVEEEWIVPLGPGWWKEWFAGLLSPLARKRFRFGHQGSKAFELGKTALGLDRLGERLYGPEPVKWIAFP